jgi:hypothetical protein
MRAGVPHRGHVRLLKTLWELGWRVVVDLHKVYTWTAADPLAKWTVAAMLRTALDAEGLPLEDFSFRYSKFDERSSMRMEVLMDAAWEKVDVVVSGNPEVLRFFEPLLIQGKTFLDARALCGDLTDFNGTRLRAAIASKNDALARTLLHPAVRARWSLEQLRAEFPRATEEIPAHPRRVEIRYTTPAGDLASVKPRAGEGPEEAIARATGVRTVIVEKSSIRLEGATAVVTVCPKYSRT